MTPMKTSSTEARTASKRGRPDSASPTEPNRPRAGVECALPSSAPRAFRWRSLSRPSGTIWAEKIIIPSVNR